MSSPVPVGAVRLNDNQRSWLRVRDHLRVDRGRLSALAAEHHGGVATLAGTALLTRPSWVPSTPVPLDEVRLEFADPTGTTGTTGTTTVGEALLSRSTLVRPLRADTTRYGSYSAVVEDLARPTVFENRPTYRLLAARLAEDPTAPPTLRLGPGHYFDQLDVGEACAHEFAAHDLGLGVALPLREALDDPCDLSRRPANLAVACLTLRHDRRDGSVTFPLHLRDPAKVGHAGGLLMVVPTGVHQPPPTSDAAGHPGCAGAELSPWETVVREFGEELLDLPEAPAPGSAEEAAARRLAEGLEAAKAEGTLHAHVLGVGVDALTLATDLLVVVTIEATVYDRLFAGATLTNAEGATSPAAAQRFTATTVGHLTREEPMQPAGAALLRLAWRHRETLLRS